MAMFTDRRRRRPRCNMEVCKWTWELEKTTLFQSVVRHYAQYIYSIYTQLHESFLSKAFTTSSWSLGVSSLPCLHHRMKLVFRSRSRSCIQNMRLRKLCISAEQITNLPIENKTKRRKHTEEEKKASHGQHRKWPRWGKLQKCNRSIHPVISRVVPTLRLF